MTLAVSCICPQVSEGIDFADARARCVMVVGIPYPHAKDSKVALKKEYNNSTAAASARAVAAVRHRPYGSSNAGGGPPRLLTGDAWYSQQAFRALNQVRRGPGIAGALLGVRSLLLDELHFSSSRGKVP